MDAHFVAGAEAEYLCNRSTLVIAWLMRSIVFFSTAVAPMSQDEIVALGEECAENDSHVGITGMLLHKNGDFLQVIEGPRAVIRDMFARISADPRHTNICKISDRIITCREFAGKTVGFMNLDELPENAPFLNPFTYEAFQADPDLAILALTFYFCKK
jgi:hypothetical protein